MNSYEQNQRDAERYSRIAKWAFIVSGVGWTVALLAMIGSFVWG